MRFGDTILAQAETLGSFTEDPPRVTRTYLSESHRRAGDFLLGLMRDAGMEADYDALGNVVGRYAADRTDAPVVMTGSHQDSVRNAGKYDGLFGILSPIAVVGELHRQNRRLPYTLEVIAYGDEEGVRFGTALIGSRAMAGAFDPAWLGFRDADGITLRDALIAFGGRPDEIGSLDRRRRNVVAFVETHIEQGPVLLNENLPVGVVTAIAGGSRHLVRVTGLAGHAGTVPMGSRRDALAAAAEMVLLVERHCTEHPGLVGTVGKIAAKPGAINVIPQDVEFSMDVRSGEEPRRHAAVAALFAGFDEIARRRGVTVASELLYDAAAAPCDPALQAGFARAIEARGIPVRHLPSGAGHDAMAFAKMCPIAMLFVRCLNGGISHHPDERLAAADADVATSVLYDFLCDFEA